MLNIFTFNISERYMKNISKIQDPTLSYCQKQLEKNACLLLRADFHKELQRNLIHPWSRLNTIWCAREQKGK